MGTLFFLLFSLCSQVQIMDYFLQCPQLDLQSHSTLGQFQKTYMAYRNWFNGREISCLAHLVGVNIPRNMLIFASKNNRSTTFTHPLLTLKSYFPRGIYSYFTRGVKLASEPTARLRESLTYTHAFLHLLHTHTHISREKQAKMGKQKQNTHVLKYLV